MKLLIATPAFGGMVTTKYMMGLIECISGLSQARIPYYIYTLDNESLISRARNKCATFAVDHGFTHLLFIDSDMVFSWKHLELLLRSDKPIIGGTYPVKTTPIMLNFNPLFSQGDEFRENRGVASFKKYAEKYADANGEVEVRHIPTGFLLINTKVFEAMKAKVHHYRTFDAARSTVQTFWDFFPVGVEGLAYRSEDWGFCDLAKDCGFQTHLQTRCVLGHTGSFDYTANIEWSEK